jgi:hypothetical protein
MGLSDCVKTLLGQYFQEPGILIPRLIDLDTVRIHNGLPELVKEFAVVDVGAVTVNSDIYTASDKYSSFEGRNWEDLELVAHELVHVEQYGAIRTASMGSKTVGTVVFGATYLAGYLGNRLLGKDPERAEADNPFEKHAEIRAAEIIRKLKADGKVPCK